ncbi:hypothetical protein [Pseudactinotalea terrae]|uniref:hypothetical protein n=1 Tax=Pseudactinotalea terrae TaxID=1743262 RepID=UPI0012E1BEC5|nr:hypothetical protein [Pseudactinotalea terrae]
MTTNEGSTVVTYLMPGKGDLYGLERDHSVGFVPIPAAAIADGLFRKRLPTRRDPRRFVPAGPRAGKGESLELYTLLLHQHGDPGTRPDLEARAARVVSVAARFDLAVLDSAATTWNENYAVTELAGEQVALVWVRFDDRLTPLEQALARYDRRGQEAEQSRRRAEAARARREQDEETLRDFAARHGLDPVHQHVRPNGGVGAPTFLSPELIDALIGEDHR